MEPAVVECLRCGHQRPRLSARRAGHDAGSCPRCSYVGWAPAAELTEWMRRLVRDVPLERRLHAPVG